MNYFFEVPSPKRLISGNNIMCTCICMNVCVLGLGWGNSGGKKE
ncbi:hypothetical protein, unlikely [Trypanosoma brucei brucei TREU927]|uniref:Uncharacterized protein n=1 Tax=Trypanosoma brucei brucei (strain 927/4 GUTat10.1) TaxID=185431 RepID=Q38F02_TRYB2|nr:hypothetical protein, unlikely [Trypanosoma brucei brucei TREU927]EAN76618.1 hypothetical protein, unlikely [Trypanosoma brucei brucei TREU927]